MLLTLLRRLAFIIFGAVLCMVGIVALACAIWRMGPWPTEAALTATGIACCYMGGRVMGV